MSLRTIIVVALSLACGLSAAVGVNSLGGPTKAAEDNSTGIVVAAVNVPRGVSITRDQLSTLAWPKDLVPPGAFTDVDDVVGRAALNQIVKDEPILNAKIASRDAGRGMAPLIPSGMRAFTINTPNVSSGVAGFILPGNHVDILLTVTSRGASRNDLTGGGSTSTLLQRIEILAVDQELDAPTANKVDAKALRSVTLLVSPDQAAKLSLAQSRGTLHLSLRNDEDEVAAITHPVTMKELRFLEEDPANAKPGTGDGSSPKRAAQPFRIRTMRGNSNGVVYVQPAE